MFHPSIKISQAYVLLIHLHHST